MTSIRFAKNAFVLLFLTFALPLLARAEAPSGNSCAACHSDLWEEMKGSVHSQQGIYCDSCHGGDPSKAEQELAKAPGTGYLGIPDKKQLVETCGACHADVERMNFYGVRTDQLARYKTSVHGKKLLLENDSRAAACSDCHGYHDVLQVSDPNSPVYPLNLPKTCDRCHGNQKLMARYGLPSDIFQTYRASVHGRALFEKKDLSAATCVSCHGSHGAVPPGVREIGETCGKCHINEKKFFLESVHAQAAVQAKFSECISCHGHHEVQPADNILYEQACLKCHDAESAAAQEGKRMLGVLSHSEEELKSAETLVKQAGIEGIFVEEEEGFLEEAKTNVIAMAPLQHSLSYVRVSELYGKFTEAARDIKSSIQGKRRSLKWRKAALIPVWIFILVMVAALWVKFKRLKSGKPNGKE